MVRTLVTVTLLLVDNSMREENSVWCQNRLTKVRDEVCYRTIALLFTIVIFIISRSHIELQIGRLNRRTSYLNDDYSMDLVKVRMFTSIVQYRRLV
jgi:hypothetical protein